ncbi:MAG: phosphoglycerate dehydrogenase [Chloroflexi bacterium]|nr:phosphoglycerate dehydrogenase [Chloroflexota bacterium]
MTWRVLISAPYMQPVVDRFANVFAEHDIEAVVPPVKERLSEEELLTWITDIDGVICGDDRFTEKVLRLAPRLKVISKWGTGIDSIDRQAARGLGIAVCNTPNAFSEPVADSVLGYVLCFARRLGEADRDMRAGIWEKRPSISLRECTLGIVGVGNVGKAVARRARAFGMTLVGHDIVEVSREFVDEIGIEMLPREQLLAKSDFVSLNCDLNPTSFHLIDAQALRLMKSTAYLINTSRGPVVDEAALVRALREKRIAGAALDVFEVEPLPSDSALRELPNVYMAPHNANSSPLAWERVHENSIRNLIRELRMANR